MGGSGGDDDDAVEAEASGRRANDALKLGAGSAMRFGVGKSIEIGPAFVVMMCRSERRRICAARCAPCSA